eukprot:50592-Chlamydomonas_euryale.AAC.1
MATRLELAPAASYPSNGTRLCYAVGAMRALIIMSIMSPCHAQVHEIFVVELWTDEWTDRWSAGMSGRVGWQALIVFGQSEVGVCWAVAFSGQEMPAMGKRRVAVDKKGQTVRRGRRRGWWWWKEGSCVGGDEGSDGGRLVGVRSGGEWWKRGVVVVEEGSGGGGRGVVVVGGEWWWRKASGG